MRIIFCGLPCSGKSTVGALLAKQLGWPFRESDRELEKHYNDNGNYSCREIFQREGSLTFRTLERESLLALLCHPLDPCIISLGGGALFEGMPLKERDRLYYLKFSYETLWQRLEKRGIPAYLLDEVDPKKRFLELAHERSLLCEKMASFVLEGNDLTPEQIVSLILEEEKIYGLK